MSGRGDQPQRVPVRSIVVWTSGTVVVLAAIVLRVLMGWRLWPWNGSGPWPGF